MCPAGRYGISMMLSLYWPMLNRTASSLTIAPIRWSHVVEALRSGREPGDSISDGLSTRGVYHTDTHVPGPVTHVR